MKPRSIALSLLGLSVVLAPPSLQAAAEMKPVARSRPATASSTKRSRSPTAAPSSGTRGPTPRARRVHVGAPGGKTSATDISSFTHEPEKILFVGGHWFVIANEGTRRAAVVGPTGRIENNVGAFGDCFVANLHGKTFVTVTDKGETPSGHVYSIAAYRPNGAQAGSKLVTIGAGGAMAGSDGLVFVAFSGGYLQALVKKAGRYNAKADVRGGTDIAVLDILSGKTGPAKKVTDLRAFLTLADKRGEKPGLEAFVRVDDDGAGLELVGPGEKLRPLALPTKFSLYEAASLQQQPAAGQLFFSLTVDPLNPDQVAAQKKGTRALHLFEAGLGPARATLLGHIPLDDDTQSYSWAAGGNKVAVLKRVRSSGRNGIVIFAR